MSLLISVLIVLVVLGLALWLVDFLPLDATVKRLIHGLAIAAVVLWLILQLVPVLRHAV